MSPAITASWPPSSTSGQLTSRISPESGIIASRPGRVAGSVFSEITAAMKSPMSESQSDSGVPGSAALQTLPITDSHRSSRRDASVVPSAGHATRTKRSTTICFLRSRSFSSRNAASWRWRALDSRSSVARASRAFP